MGARAKGRAMARAAAAAGLLLLLAVSGARAAGSSKHALLLAKALSYERRLAETKGHSVGIAVVYAEDSEASRANAQSWVQAFQALGPLKVHGAPVEVLAVPFQRERVAGIVRSRGIDVLMACEGSPFSAVAGLARELRILSATDGRGGVAENLSLGILIERDKPRILINVRAAKAEGAEFSAKLLQLAELR